MIIKSRILCLVFSLLFLALSSGCADVPRVNIDNLDPPVQLPSSAITPKLITPVKMVTNTLLVIPTTLASNPSLTPSPTSTPLPTDPPLATQTTLPAETPATEWHPAGHVTAPILLYHHVSDDEPENRYFVTVTDFQTQMVALRDWGYSTMTASELASVIIDGGYRPSRAVVITFDDGFADVYHHALPIMQEMGFVGVMYIYVDHVGSRGYVTVEQIRGLADNGWEIGNHSMSHADLTNEHSNLYFEVVQSRIILEEMTGINADTFAYPYGESDDYVVSYVRNCGYLAGMALGLNYEHTLDTLFRMTRIEVQGDYSFSRFEELLPWSGQ